MEPGQWASSEEGGEGVPIGDAVPDVIGLELAEALERLKDRRYTLRFTAPPRPRGEKGAVRVVACRRHGPEQALEVICAREYWDRPPGSDAGPDGGEDGSRGPQGDEGSAGEGGGGGHADE